MDAHYSRSGMDSGSNGSNSAGGRGGSSNGGVMKSDQAAAMSGLAMDHQSSSSGRSTPSDLPHNKLFVGGLSWQTSADKLREYFGQYGTIIDVQVLKDPLTQVGYTCCYCFLFFFLSLSQFGSPLWGIASYNA